MAEKLSDEALDSIVGGGGVPTLIHYTVQRGDNLEKIAHRYGATVRAIMNYNPFIKSPSSITAGWDLIIPSKV